MLKKDLIPTVWCSENNFYFFQYKNQYRLGWNIQTYDTDTFSLTLKMV